MKKIWLIYLNIAPLNSFILLRGTTLLKLLFCPFKVHLKHDIGTLKKGQVVWVEEVKLFTL